MCWCYVCVWLIVNAAVYFYPVAYDEVFVLFEYGFGQSYVLVLHSAIFFEFDGVSYNELCFAVGVAHVYMGWLVVAGVDAEYEAEEPEYFWHGVWCYVYMCVFCYVAKVGLFFYYRKCLWCGFLSVVVVSVHAAGGLADGGCGSVVGVGGWCACGWCAVSAYGYAVVH